LGLIGVGLSRDAIAESGLLGSVTRAGASIPVRREETMSNGIERVGAPESPVWLRGLGALLLVLMGGAIGWALWIAVQNFGRIGV